MASYISSLRSTCFATVTSNLSVMVSSPSRNAPGHLLGVAIVAGYVQI